MEPQFPFTLTGNSVYPRNKNMRNYHKVLTLVVAVLATNNIVNAGVSDQCKRETKALHEDDFLRGVQRSLYQKYIDEIEATCDIGLHNFECDYQFLGNNKTYLAACAEKGGQIFRRNTHVICGIDPVTLSYFLGAIPACIGASCNPSKVEWNELNETNVKQLLEDLDYLVQDLTVNGCAAEFSPGLRRYILLH